MVSKINPLDDLLVLDRREQITDENLEEYNKIYDMITHSIKLEELVEEEIKEKNTKLKDMDDKHLFHAMPSYYHQQEYVRDTLQSLIEKSKKESKE